MGCLFGKAKNTEDTSNNEVQLQENNIQPVPFNDLNNSYFLGYPKYRQLTQTINQLLESNVNTWQSHKQELSSYLRNIEKYLKVLNQELEDQKDIPNDFNMNFQNCLILDIQCGKFDRIVPGKVNIILHSTSAETKTIAPAQYLIWNEAKVFAIQEVDNQFELECGQERVTFQFDELKDQQIHEKVVKMKSSGILQIKCQLINDLDQFREWWRGELVSRREQILRMMQKIEAGVSENDIAFQSLMSVSNRMGTETVYEIPYQVK